MFSLTAASVQRAKQHGIWRQNSPMSRVSDQEPENSNLIIVEYNLISSARAALHPLAFPAPPTDQLN
jgi:hypothetical protein